MLRLLLAASVATAWLPMGAWASPVHPQLNAKVGARGISLTDMNGRRVKVLLQNSYRIVVKDSSTAQNFHLVGPGVNLRTKASARATRVWVVNLRPGSYVYTSDRSSKLRGTFTVHGPAPA